MKYARLILLLLPFVACKKKTDNSFPSLYQFTLNNSGAIALPYLGTGSVTVNAVCVGTTTGTVNIAAQNPPVNLTATSSPATAKTPFSTVVTIASSNVNSSGYFSDTWGTFNIKMMGRGFYQDDSTAFQVTVAPPDNVITYFPGTWIMSNQCQNDSVQFYDYYVNVSLDSTVSNGLILAGFSGTSSVLRAVVDPVAKTVTIPTQVYGGYTYSGSGTFVLGGTKSSEIDMSYTIVGTGLNYSCDGSMTK